MRVSAIAGRLGFVLAVASCGGGKKDGGAAPVPSDDFAISFSDAYCGSIGPCCGASGIAFDRATCENALRGVISAQFDLVLANPHVRYEPTAAGGCIAAYTDALQSCTDRDKLAPVSQACAALFQGTVAPGGTCGENRDCAQPVGGRATCDAAVCVVGDATPDSAFEQPRGAVGSFCNATCRTVGVGSSCGSSGASAAPGASSCWLEDGVYCGASGTCQPSPRIGQPCGFGSACEAAGHCSGGQCVDNTADGPCVSGTDCTAQAYCDSTAQRCAALKIDGMACNSDGECLGGECYQDRCRSWSIATAQHCAGLLGD